MWASRRLASEARLLLSQVVDRVGRIEAPPPLAAAFMHMYRLTGGSISGLLRKRATANPFTQASCYSWSSKGNTSTTVWQKKFRSVQHFLKPPAIDKQPEANAKMYVNQKAWRDAANLKAHISSRAFLREIPVRGRFLRAPFSTTFRWRIFFSNRRELISRCMPKEPISVKNSNSTNSPNLSFKVARNEVKNSSFAQRSAHREVKNMATGIDLTGHRAQATRASDDERSNPPTPTHRFATVQYLILLPPPPFMFGFLSQQT